MEISDLYLLIAKPRCGGSVDKKGEVSNKDERTSKGNS